VRQNQFDRQYLQEYRERTEKSADRFESAKQTLPGGIGGSAPNYDPYPFFADRADGAEVWDIDGNKYLDFNLCWGVLSVGHCHPKLIDAIQDQAASGTMYGFPHEETTEVSEALVDRFPVDKVRFTNSGSESTLYAIRLARRFTGNEKIVKIEGGYHGVSDSLHVSKRPPIEKAGHPEEPNQVPYGEGIPDQLLEQTVVVPFNDTNAIERSLDKNRGDVACVIVEPVMMNAAVIPPEEGYLEELRKLTTEHNTVLVFDEVKTGVKLAPGGAAEYYDVKPDLITLAKAIGGGLPIGAVAGSAKIMDQIGDEGLFGTFSANPLSIRASNVVLTEILTKDQYTRLENLGSMLYAGYRDIIADHDIEATVQDVHSVGGPIFTANSVENYREWEQSNHEIFEEYWIRMSNNGVIPTCYGSDEQANISVQHTEEDIETHLEAFKTVAPHLKRSA